MLKKSDIESIVLLALTMESQCFEHPHLSYREYLALERDFRIFGFSGISELMENDCDAIVERLSLGEELVMKAKNRLQEIGAVLRYLDSLATRGIYVVTKFDREFPFFIKQKGKDKSAFFLYYSGSLNNVVKGIRISGLTDCMSDERRIIEQLVLKMKKENKPYISIGEKGVDQLGFNLALKHNVNIVLIVYNDYFELLNRYQDQLKNKKMVILSQFEPNSIYDPTNEIVSDGLSSRFSDFRIIMSSKLNSGLTWFNAIQNLTFKWTRIFVVNNKCTGNQKLLEQHYVKFNPVDSDSEFSFEYIYEKNRRLCIVNLEEFTQMSIFDFIPGGSDDEQITAI